MSTLFTLLLDTFYPQNIKCVGAVVRALTDYLTLSPLATLLIYHCILQIVH